MAELELAQNPFGKYLLDTILKQLMKVPEVGNYCFTYIYGVVQKWMDVSIRGNLSRNMIIIHWISGVLHCWRHPFHSLEFLYVFNCMSTNAVMCRPLRHISVYPCKGKSPRQIAKLVPTRKSPMMEIYHDLCHHKSIQIIKKDHRFRRDIPYFLAMIQPSPPVLKRFCLRFARKYGGSPLRQRGQHGSADLSRDSHDSHGPQQKQNMMDLQSL